MDGSWTGRGCVAECVRGLTFRACVGDRPGRAGQGARDVRQYILLLLLLRHIIMTAMATTFPVSESGSLVMCGFPASLSATRTSTRRSRRGALNDGGCHPPSEARPWRPEISATALQIIAGEHTLVETRRSRGADVTCAETAVRVRSDGAAWRGQRRSGWEVVEPALVCVET